MSRPSDQTTDRMAAGLGWMSLGLGTVQLAASDLVTRLTGVDDSRWARTMVRLVGVRELVHAACLLGSRRPAPWVWTRVAGDAIDLTALGVAMSRRTGTRRVRAMGALAAVACITTADLYTAMRAYRYEPRRAEGPMHLRAAITVNSSRQEVYAMWRDLENLPRFMAHLESVQMIGDGLSRWRAKGPATKTIQWEAEFIEDRPGELIAWRSTRGSAIGNSGRVRFADAPGGRGTEVRVEITYDAPGGKVALALARLLGEHPEQQVRDDLRRFKQVMEIGEVIRSEGSPEGTRALRQVRQRPAQPMRTAQPVW
ncbi:SRPBCC family protein [Sphaerisporangium fuscum]|uniref:SRPBCC family protein n=1 Tax=Sphaerisporangium fuscum TaxID=2835868 RepID=UPI001BDC24E0|nr:SRPBCC family protein [Sphaerisporangium fuscum]